MKSKQWKSHKSCSRYFVFTALFFPINIRQLLNVSFVIMCTMVGTSMFWRIHHPHVSTKPESLIGHRSMLLRFSVKKLNQVEHLAHDQWPPHLYVEPVIWPKNLCINEQLHAFQTQNAKILVWACLQRLFIEIVRLNASRQICIHCLFFVVRQSRCSMLVQKHVYKLDALMTRGRSFCESYLFMYLFWRGLQKHV